MSSSSAFQINYATYAGLASLPAAIIFAALYSPFCTWFVRKSFSHPTYVHYVMALFCAIRVTAFILRAILIGSETAGENLGLLIGDQILFGVGYAGLLYASYTLVLDLEQISDKVSRANDNAFSEITQNRHLYRLILSAAVVTGIIASTSVNNDGTFKPTAITLREVSTALFLALTALLVIKTVLLAQFRMTSSSNMNHNGSIGSKHGSIVLVIISLLLLVREAFITATVTPSTHQAQSNEHFWYPLVVVPEFVAIVLYTTPGLVPSKRELDMNPA